MPDFSFSGRDSSGNKVSGKRQAGTPSDLAIRLQEEGILPIEITPVAVAIDYRSKLRQLLPGRGVSLPELLMFCRQMHTLIKAGIPILTAVTRLSETTRNKLFMKVLEDINEKLSSGRNLAFALAQHPKIFSPLFVNIVEVGENTGKLEEVFLQLASYFDLEQQTNKRISTALRYPAIVLTAALIAIIVINGFVIPSFAKMFETFHAQLPLPTRILMMTSHIMTHYWYLFIIGFVLLIGVGGWYLKTASGKMLWNKLQLKIPFIGPIIYQTYLARFCRLFALILSAGIPAIEGIRMVAESIGNDFILTKIFQMRELVSRGSSIAVAAKNIKLFSPLIIQMLALGEETGKMEEMLIDVATFYEGEVEYDLDKLGDAIEPVLLVVMAGMVLVLALGVFLPMWDMGNLATSQK